MFRDDFPGSRGAAVAGAGLFPCGAPGSKHTETTEEKLYCSASLWAMQFIL